MRSRMASAKVESTSKERVTIEQSKSKGRVSFGLRDYIRVALKDWINEADKAYGEPIFTSLKGKGYPWTITSTS